ncbi:hypothetical protein CYY_002881 [Polysphondylium violaceum]|uniref:Uncharacterized protein n=1 Tax=Polysphondylium violaceum TaxID=133409 RepID=A0A8J4PVL1_9MYCE|nr:hypothetical protein CYY_002881 [Polysphondylium violaceum]
MEEIIKVNEECRKAYKAGSPTSYLFSLDKINQDYFIDDEYKKVLDTLKASINLQQEIKNVQQQQLIIKPIPCHSGFQQINKKDIEFLTITTQSSITSNTNTTTKIETDYNLNNDEPPFYTPSTSPPPMICPKAPTKPIPKNQFKHQKLMAMNRGSLDFSNC